MSENAVTVKVTPRPATDVDVLSTEVGDYITAREKENEELVSLLTEFVERFKQIEAENDKAKSLLRDMLTNPVMKNGLSTAKEILEKGKKDV